MQKKQLSLIMYTETQISNTTLSNKVNFIMLKFLQNREEDRSPKRSPKKFLPEMCYGNSLQSPQQFQTRSTIYHMRTYVNPFLNFEKSRQSKLPQQSRSNIHPQWTKKRNLSMIQQHKILKDQKQSNYDHLKSRYLQSFHQELENNHNRFHITRGEFTNFLEKNNHYKSIGPLQGIQRTMDRIEDRKKTVWEKSPSKRQEMTTSLRYASSSNTTVKSSIGKNSQLLTEKIRIRRNRQKIQKLFKRELQNRKKQIKTYNFSMSKDSSQTDFFLPDATAYNKRDTFQQVDEGLNDLDNFENKLTKKFK